MATVTTTNPGNLYPAVRHCFINPNAIATQWSQQRLDMARTPGPNFDMHGRIVPPTTVPFTSGAYPSQFPSYQYYDTLSQPRYGLGKCEYKGIYDNNCPKPTAIGLPPNIQGAIIRHPVYKQGMQSCKCLY